MSWSLLRRRFLEAAGAAATSLIAGCSTGKETGQGTDPGATTSTRTDTPTRTPTPTDTPSPTPTPSLEERGPQNFEELVQLARMRGRERLGLQFPETEIQETRELLDQGKRKRAIESAYTTVATTAPIGGDAADYSSTEDYLANGSVAQMAYLPDILETDLDDLYLDSRRVFISGGTRDATKIWDRQDDQLYLGVPFGRQTDETYIWTHGESIDGQFEDSIAPWGSTEEPLNSDPLIYDDSKAFNQYSDAAQSCRVLS